jgi:hypothetical protein
LADEFQSKTSADEIVLRRQEETVGNEAHKTALRWYGVLNGGRREEMLHLSLAERRDKWLRRGNPKYIYIYIYIRTASVV